MIPQNIVTKAREATDGIFLKLVVNQEWIRGGPHLMVKKAGWMSVEAVSISRGKKKTPRGDVYVGVDITFRMGKNTGTQKLDRLLMKPIPIEKAIFDFMKKGREYFQMEATDGSVKSKRTALDNKDEWTITFATAKTKTL